MVPAASRSRWLRATNSRGRPCRPGGRRCSPTGAASAWGLALLHTREDSGTEPFLAAAKSGRPRGRPASSPAAAPRPAAGLARRQALVEQPGEPGRRRRSRSRPAAASSRPRRTGAAERASPPRARVSAWRASPSGPAVLASTITDPGAVGVGCGELEQPAQAGAEAIRPRRPRRCGGGDFGARVGDAPVVERQEALLLAGEQGVEAADADVRSGDEVVDGGRAVAALGEDCGGGASTRSRWCSWRTSLGSCSPADRRRPQVIWERRHAGKDTPAAGGADQAPFEVVVSNTEHYRFHRWRAGVTIRAGAARPRSELARIRADREEKAAAARRRIELAMLETCGERGYRAVSVQQVIDRCGGNRAQFYRHLREQGCLLRGGLRRRGDARSSRRSSTPDERRAAGKRGCGRRWPDWLRPSSSARRWPAASWSRSTSPAARPWRGGPSCSSGWRPRSTAPAGEPTAGEDPPPLTARVHARRRRLGGGQGAGGRSGAAEFPAVVPELARMIVAAYFGEADLAQPEGVQLRTTLPDIRKPSLKSRSPRTKKWPVGQVP